MLNNHVGYWIDLVGYKLSPLLWKKIRFGLSAGRVQSVALKFIVDRERERDAFDPEEYWKVQAFLLEDKPKSATEYEVRVADSDEEDDKGEREKAEEEGIKFELQKVDGKKPNVTTQSKAEKILEELKKTDWKIGTIETKQSKKKP